MPLYKYDSYSRRGDRVKGTIDAGTAAAAKELLRGQGLMPVSIAEVAGEARGESFFGTLFERKVDFKTVILFTKQLGVLLRSGIPLLQALELLIEQFEGRFRRILINIRDGLREGKSLADGLMRYPRVFSNVYVQLVKAGEASGKLENILERLTDYLERAEETKKRISKALSYPIMMLSFAVLVVVVLLTVLVPKLTSIFASSGKALPGPTQLLLVMSDGLRNHFLVLGIGFFASLAAFLSWKSTAKGKETFDNLLLHLPMTAYFARTKAVVQFSKTLGMLIESGVNLAEALDIVCNIVENKVLTKKLKQARDNIIKEGKIAKFLKDTGMFPKIASYMINTGEESGKLGKMLITVGDDYEVELRDLTDALTAKIGPLMTIVMGAIIGFIILAVFMPIMQMGDMTGI